MDKDTVTSVVASARLGVLLGFALLLTGCAGMAPSKSDSGQPKDEQNGFTVKDSVPIDSDARADFEAGVKLLKNGDYEKGIALLQKVIERSPKATVPYIDIAIAYEKLNKLEPAEKNLKKALELSPDHPVANNEYGIVCRKQGRFAEAKKVYEKVIDKYPDFLPARKNLGVLCDIYMKDLPCAVEQYEVYSKAVPGDKKVAMWIVDLKRREGE